MSLYPNLYAVMFDDGENYWIEFYWANDEEHAEELADCGHDLSEAPTYGILSVEQVPPEYLKGRD